MGKFVVQIDLIDWLILAVYQLILCYFMFSG